MRVVKGTKGIRGKVCFFFFSLGSGFIPFSGKALVMSAFQVPTEK